MPDLAHGTLDSRAELIFIVEGGLFLCSVKWWFALSLHTTDNFVRISLIGVMLLFQQRHAVVYDGMTVTMPDRKMRCWCLCWDVGDDAGDEVLMFTSWLGDGGDAEDEVLTFVMG